MYLQDTAQRRNSSATQERIAGGIPRLPKNDVAMRAGVALLVASGAILGAINVLVMIHLVAVAIGG